MILISPHLDGAPSLLRSGRWPSQSRSGWMNNGEHMNEGMGGRERLWSREVVRQLSITYGEISAEPVGRQESDRIDNYLTGFVTIQPQHLTAG